MSGGWTLLQQRWMVSKGNAGKVGASDAPMKVVLGRDKDLPQFEQGVERKGMVVAAMVGRALRTQCPLWWPAVMGGSVELQALATVEAILEAVVVLGVTAAA